MNTTSPATGQRNPDASKSSNGKPTAAIVFGVLAGLFILALGSIFLVPKLVRSSAALPKKQSLYDRLGGVFAIAVVNLFSDLLVKDDLLGVDSPNPALRDWNRNQIGRLPGLKFQRTLWLCAAAGGPYVYHGTVPDSRVGPSLGLGEAHFKFAISPVEFDRATQVLERAMVQSGVPQQERSEVLAAFTGHKSDVTAGFFTKDHPEKSTGCPFAKMFTKSNNQTGRDLDVFVVRKPV